MATIERPAPATVLAEHGLTAEALYDELTAGATRSLRLDDLLYEAAERVPGRRRRGPRSRANGSESWPTRRGSSWRRGC